MKKLSKTLLIALLGLGAVGCETFPTGSNNTGSTVLTGDALILDELLARVAIPENNTEIMNNFTLPATVKFENNVGEITWESDSGYVIVQSNKTTVESAGVSREVYNAIVVRPEAGKGNATVKLTATVTFNGKTGTKTQKVTVVQSTAATEDSWGTFSAPVDTLKISTWEEWTKKESGTIAVKGIITGYVYQEKYTNSNVFLQDKDGGYYAYAVGDMSAAEAANYLAVGNEVIFEGEKSVYNGLHEFNQEKVTGIKVLSRGNTVAPTDVTEAATEGKLTRYQAMYVKANGMFVVEEGKNYLQFGSNKYQIYHDAKYVGSYYDKVTGQLDALNPGDMVDALGFVGCHNADQFHLTDVVKSAEQVELTDEQKFGFAKDGVNTKLNKYTSEAIDKVTEIDLYQYTDDTVSVTYALDSNADTSVFVLGNDKLTVNPTEEEKTATLSVTIKVGTFEETLTFTLTAFVSDKVKYEINGSLPEGLTFISSYAAEFYGNGGLKLTKEGQGVQTANFEATNSVEVSFNILALNGNTKTAGSAEYVFTITGHDANGNVVATAGYNDVVKGDNTVTLTADSASIVSVKILYTRYYNDGTKCYNLSLGGVTLNFGEPTGGETPENPGEQPGETPDTPTDTITTIAAALAASEGASVVLEGTVSEIYYSWSTQWNNMSFYITDDAGDRILIFRATEQVEIGDKVRVEGKITIYSGSGTPTAQVAEGNTCTITEKGDYQDPTENATASLDFSDVSNRVSQSGDSQVWSQNGITFTNNKNKSTQAIADYSDPVRCYKGTSIKIEYTSNITKIIFVTTGDKHFASSFTVTGANVTVDGSTCTIELSTPATSFEIAELPYQVRISTLSVYTA